MTNISLSGVNYSQLNSFVEGLSSDDMKVTLSDRVEGSNDFTISLTKDGQTTQLQVALPDLDEAETESTSEALEKMKEKVDALISGLSTVVAPNTSCFVDLYSILSLLQKCSQQLKASSQQARTAEHQALQRSLLNQASAARTAAATAYGQAITGCIINAVMTGVSVAMTAVSLVVQIKSFAGADAGKVDIKTNQQNLENTAKIEDVEIPTTEASTAKFNELKTAGVISEQTETARTDYQTKLGASKQADVKLAEAKAARTEIENNADLSKTEKTEKLAACDQQIDKLTDKANQAKVEACEAGEQYRTCLKTDLAAAPENEELSTFAAGESAGMKPTLIAGYKVKLEAAQATYRGALNDALHSKGMKVAESLTAFGQAVNSLGSTGQTFMQAAAEQTTKNSEADDKEMQANQEGIRAQMEQMDDLTGSLKELSNAILQLLQAIVEVEHQSEEQVINA